MEQIEILKEFVISNFLFGKSTALGYDTDFLEKGIIDSIRILELVCFVEETFNFKVLDDEILHNNFSSLTKLNNYINLKLDQLQKVVQKCAV
jgi:acyl carrier protein